VKDANDSWTPGARCGDLIAGALLPGFRIAGRATPGSNPSARKEQTSVIRKRPIWLAASALVAAAALGGWATVNARAGAAAQIGGKSFYNRKPFTADMVMTGGRGGEKQSREGKVYAGANAYRMDMEIQAEMKTTMIVRYDKKVVWMLMPGQQRYMEMPITPRAGMMSALRDSDAKVETKDLGPDKVGEYTCEKYRVHTVSQGHDYNGSVWIGKGGDADGFIVKTQDEQTGASMEYRNIHPGEPDASLFEVPAGYQKFQMPGMPQD
jgi:outer membrane lipoprotein-sorting protein